MEYNAVPPVQNTANIIHRPNFSVGIGIAVVHFDHRGTLSEMKRQDGNLGLQSLQ